MNNLLPSGVSSTSTREKLELKGTNHQPILDPCLRMVLLLQMLFEYNRTGFLPLSIVGHVDCDDPFLPAGVIPQIYAMFANELCPPVGYTSSFEGQFIVSKLRIQRHGWWIYQRLQVPFPTMQPLLGETIESTCRNAS